MTVAGGLRGRLIHDSLVAHLREGLTQQGWFDSGRRHMPIKLIARPQDWDEPVEPNTVAVSTNEVDAAEAETGSNLTLDTITTTVDLFAESDSVGVDLINDARDILRGRLGPRTTNTFPLVDFREATPAPVGYITVNSVAVIHQVSPTQRAWMQFWYGLQVELHDWYYGEES